MCVARFADVLVRLASCDLPDPSDVALFDDEPTKQRIRALFQHVAPTDGASNIFTVGTRLGALLGALPRVATGPGVDALAFSRPPPTVPDGLSLRSILIGVDTARSLGIEAQVLQFGRRPHVLSSAHKRGNNDTFSCAPFGIPVVLAAQGKCVFFFCVGAKC